MTFVVVLLNFPKKDKQGRVAGSKCSRAVSLDCTIINACNSERMLKDKINYMNNGVERTVCLCSFGNNYVKVCTQ